MATNLERWVFTTDPDAVRAYCDGASDSDREEVEAIVTEYIALGDDPLTTAFPELAYAAPATQ